MGGNILHVVMTLWIFLFTIGTLPHVLCEIRFVCPRPTTPKANMKNGECLKTFRDYSVVHPGLLTVHYEEPIVRKGSVMRVELADLDTQVTPCLLLDHIPHNDALTVSNSAECKVDNYPVGKCGTSSYITINIPDIKCERCVLIIKSIIFEKGVSSCFEDYCDWFYSCSNIRIRPSNPNTVTSTFSCNSLYKNHVFPKWSMTSLLLYQPVKNVPGSVFAREYFLFYYNKDTHQITYDVYIPLPQIEVLSMHIRRSLSSKQFMAALQWHKYNHFKGTLPQNKVRQFLTAFARNGPLVRISFIHINKPDRQYSNYTTQLKITQENLYAPISWKYSSQGWIDDDRFVGEKSTYPDVVYPAGICAPAMKQYGVSLRNSTNEPSGVVSIIINDFTHIVGVFPGNDVEWNVSIDSQPVPKKFVSSNTVRLAKRSTKVPTQVRIDGLSQDKMKYTFKGQVKKALSAIAPKENNILGVAILSLLDHSKLGIEYFLRNPRGQIPSPTEVVLTYPSSADVIHNISTSIVQMPISNFMYGGWTTKASVEDNGNGLFLRTGHFGLQSSTRDDKRYVYSMQFSTPDDSFCAYERHMFCDALVLDNDNSQVRAHGYLWSQKVTTTSIRMRILIREATPGMTVASTYFYRNNPSINILSSSFDMKFDKSYEPSIIGFKITVSVSSGLMNDWLSKKIHVAVALNDGYILTSRVKEYSTAASLTSKHTTASSSLSSSSSSSSSSLSSSKLSTTSKNSIPTKEVRPLSTSEKVSTKTKTPTIYSTTSSKVTPQSTPGTGINRSKTLIINPDATKAYSTRKPTQTRPMLTTTGLGASLHFCQTHFILTLSVIIYFYSML